MTNLTLYGGVNEIGGNKILLEDGERSIFLDFGFPYGKHKLFYEEFLKPRGGAGLLDPLVMGLIPPLDGLYRDDFAEQELWQRFVNNPGYRKVKRPDGVILTHAHLDHSGHISFLHPDIKVYATAITAFLTKAIQDSGKSDFDQQVCYFSPAGVECPAGWKQVAVVSSGDAKLQRQYCIADRDPEYLSEEAKRFWMSGFWEKGPRQKEMKACDLMSHKNCSFNLRCFPVDHSILGASAWGIETSSGWVIYSGDLRLHGKRSELTKSFIREAAALRPKVLILEGTNIGRKANTSEVEVYNNALKAITGAKGLVIADFSARDVDRLLTFLQIAKETGRRLVILAKDAYLLRTLHLLDPDIPDVGTEANFLVYQETTASKYPSTWLRNLYQDYDGRIVLARDIHKEQYKFILAFSFFDLNELPSIDPDPGGLYVFSSSEPHDEEQEIDFRRLQNWLDHFSINGFGLPVETDGAWNIPEEERGLHASGHACGTDLLNIVQEIKPEILIPVHSQNPAVYAESLAGSGIRVVLPELNSTIDI